jgi:hypothetical protein
LFTLAHRCNDEFLNNLLPDLCDGKICPIIDNNENNKDTFLELWQGNQLFNHPIPSSRRRLSHWFNVGHNIEVDTNAPSILFVITPKAMKYLIC